MFGLYACDYTLYKVDCQAQNEEIVEKIVAILVRLLYINGERRATTVKISEKILRLRTDHGLTQKEFGEIAGASDKAVSTWELGVKSPRMSSIYCICSRFDIDVNQFIDPDSDVYDHVDATQKEKMVNDRYVRMMEREMANKNLRFALFNSLENMETEDLQAVLDYAEYIKMKKNNKNR